MTYIKIILLQVVLCSAAAASAQDAEQQRSALRNNNINQKRTATIQYSNGQQTDSFVSASTSFNRLGFPLQQTLFNKYGKVQGRFDSQYQSDSLEIKQSSFDSSGNSITETFRSYNPSGELISMKAVLYVSNRTIYHVFEYDSTRLLRKDYILDDDTKNCCPFQRLTATGNCKKAPTMTGTEIYKVLLPGNMTPQHKQEGILR